MHGLSNQINQPLPTCDVWTVPGNVRHLRSRLDDSIHVVGCGGMGFSGKAGPDPTYATVKSWI